MTPKGLRDLATPGGPIRRAPLIESLEPKQVDALAERARRNDPQFVPPDFSSWYQTRVPAGIVPEELVKVPRALEFVEIAYVIRPGPPPAATQGDHG